jgi:LEA14-like dessication related protein
MKRMRYLLFGLLVLALAGCSSLGSVVQEPSLSLESVEITGISVRGVDLVCHVSVRNPNGFSIPFPKVDWELFINSNSFVRGTVENDAVIKGRSTTVVDVPFSVTYGGLYNSFRSLLNAKEAAYNISLGISFPIPLIREKTFRLDFAGVLPMLQMPKITPGAFRVARVDFSGIDLACDFNVENPNAFAIPLPRTSWTFAAAGVPLTVSSGYSKGELAAGAVNREEVVVSLLFADLLKLPGSVAGTEVPSKLALEASLPIPDFEEFTSSLDVPGTIPVLKKPELSFKGINIKSLGMQRLEFVLNWEVDNQNSFSFDINKFEYDFKVNNTSWTSGAVTDPPVVKAKGKTVIPLTFVVSSLSMVTDIVSIISKGTAVAYDCTGGLSLAGDLPGLDKLDLPFSFKGNTRITN